MAIELIDKIKQKNGGTFKLVDSEDVAYGDSSVEEEINKFYCQNKAHKSLISIQICTLLPTP